MARFEDAGPILEAAARWKSECLLNDGSIFSDRRLWTVENLDYLQRHYVENLDAGREKKDFLPRLRVQLNAAPPQAKQLAAEILWVLYLMVIEVISPATKRKQIQEVWEWSGERISGDHWALGDVLASGVANPGIAYNTHRWRELRFFITAMVDLKALDRDERETLLGQPWGFARWLENREFARHRQLRHVLLFLLFPETFERIATGTHKERIVRSFRREWNEDPEDFTYDDLVALDQEVLRIRERLEEEHEEEEIDFYRPPAVETWKSDGGGGGLSLDAEVLQRLKETFLKRLPGFESFQLERGLYWNWERGYKEELRESFQETVLQRLNDRETGPGWADALREAVYDLLTRRLEMAGGEQQNLVSWRYYTFLRELDDKEVEQFAESFVDLLRGEGSSAERVERFNEEMLPILERHDAGNDAVTRSFPTLFLMLDDPDQEIFIRTRLFNRVANRLLGNTLFDNRPLGREGYERALELASALRGELESWGWEPQDLIDVQSFMWVSGSERSGPDVSHWIFQSNPDYFDLEGYARSQDRISLLVNQHADDIELGDCVYLWESGEDAGILGRARVIDGPRERPADGAGTEFDRGEPDRFHGEKTRARLYVEEVLDERVSRDRLREDPALEDLSILRMPQGTNFPVSEEEAEVVDAYIEGEGPSTPTYLKIAPGRKGGYWEDCLRDDVIVVGWDDLGDLRDYESIDELREAVTRLYGDGDEGLTPTLSRTANGLWKFRNLRPGDRIVTNRGTSEVLGVGEVRAPGYGWEPEREKYRHTVSVDWDTSLSGDVADRGGAWGYTIAELEEDEYGELLEELTGDTGFDGLLEDLESKGFHFPPESVANYLLALQTKRFVILTGISGTGKTRLAIETAKHFRPLVESERVVESPDEGVEIEVYPYMPKYGQMVVPVALSSRVRVFDGSEQRSTEVEVRYPKGTTRLTLSREPDRNVTYLNFRGDFRKWFTETFEEGDKLFLDVESTDEEQGQRFVLRGAETRREKTRLDNYQVVDVHPDWTDNRGLLGYYNPITEQYRPTPFLDLLMRAAREEERAGSEARQPHPFFVILDEMNLARVEHYFSDFLSALESEEPIHLHDDPSLEAGNVEEGRPIPQRFEIPDNVFFTGTVNVDETTYMFSPKVLDRAFTIELNRVDLRGYGESSSFASAADSLGIDELDTPLVCERRPNSEDWGRFGELLDGDLQQLVIRLNELLTEDNLHFGYRVANEIARFVLLATSQSTDGDEAAWAALDLAVMEKVLPKFHGTEQELGSVLRKLFTFAVEPGDISGSEEEELVAIDWKIQNGRLQASSAEEAEAPDPFLPRTGAKLWRMLGRLRDQGFTSFIE